MSYQSVARAYLEQLAGRLKDGQATDEATAEMSYRTALDTFLQEILAEINSNVAVILEPKRRPTGAPDFRVHDRNTLGVYGFIEAKGPQLGAALDETFLNKHASQIERYRSLGYRVIATDGLDFFLFAPDELQPLSAKLVDKPISVTALPGAPIDGTLYALLTKFLSAPTFRYVGEQGLVELTAKHAREIARVVAELTPLLPDAALNEVERRTIERLHSVHCAVADHLDPHLRSVQDFGGFVAQVLAFSLLYAHRVEHRNASTPQELYDRLVDWGSSGDDGTNHRLRPFRELIRLLGDELQPGSSGDLGRIYDTLRSTLAYVGLPLRISESPDFHTLYEAFLGKFDNSLRERYGAYYTPQVLASACVRLTLEATGLKTSRSAKIIEPCCGTGSFIDALQEARVASTIIGLEVLPSAYALASFRQSMVSRRPSEVQIVLTNTMADELVAEEQHSSIGRESLFEIERSEARSAVRPPVVLVIGNPPASDVSTSDLSFCREIYRHLEDFRPPSRRVRANVQKQTTSTAMQFLRWSCERVIKNGAGAVSLLLPSSFINKPSYMTARKWIRQHFGRIWVLEIDGDARAGAQSNIFQVQQGRALVIAELGSSKEVRYASIADLSRRQKLNWLKGDASKILKEFTLLPDDSEDAALTPVAARRDDWLKMVALWSKSGEPCIFVHECSGVKLAPTSIFVNARRSILQRRLLDLANFPNAVQDYIAKWFKGQARPPQDKKFTSKVRSKLVAAAIQDGSYRLYALRPFFTSWALISEDVLRTLSGQPNSGTRYRPELLLAFADRSNIAIGITPAPDDVSERIGRPAVLLRNLPDNDLSRRGNIRVLAARSPGNKRGGGWGALCGNVNESLSFAYREIAEELAMPVEDAIVVYCYAVLSCQWFLDEWSDQLMECTGDRMPRVPLPKDPSLFKKVVLLGQSLDAAEHKVGQLPNCDGFVDFKLASFGFDVTGALNLLDDSGAIRWCVSDMADFKDFEVGGYKVVSEVLKWLSFKYLRAELSREELAKLYQIRSSLSTHVALQPALESAVRLAVSAEQLEIL